MRAFLAALSLCIGCVVCVPAEPREVADLASVSVEQKPSARKFVARTLHRYRPRAHSRRASRWSIKRPARPVGVPPPGFVRSNGDLLAQAKSAIGLTARQLGVPATLWCADALNVFLRRSGLPTVKSRFARAFTTYGSPLSDPRPGAIAVFSRGRAPNGHVGVVASVNGGKVRVISGNCLGRVCISEYPTSRVLAWRWPGRAASAEPRDTAKVIPLPRSRPMLASDFADLNIVPPGTLFNLALLDTEAMPVATAADPIEIEYEDPLIEARRYLVATATPGLTMQWQGAGLAIERLHPQFAIRLAAAIREARAAGLERAGIFSAYRPPAFGVGGFSDKFNSMHAYGMAVDMTGVGGPGSAQSLQWNRIAAKHKIYGPYGPNHRAEWNHYQPTWTRAIAKHEPLRAAITARGPIDLPRMWKIAESLIDRGPHRIFKVGKRKQRYAKRWSKKRWAAFKRKLAAKKQYVAKKLKKKKIAAVNKRRVASR